STWLTPPRRGRSKGGVAHLACRETTWSSWTFIATRRYTSSLGGNMHPSRALAVVLVLIASASAAEDPAAAGVKEAKIVFDVTEGDAKVFLERLEAIDETRKDLAAAGLTPQLVIALRGGATLLV